MKKLYGFAIIIFFVITEFFFNNKLYSDEYVAYSLNGAKNRLYVGSDQPLPEELNYLGGITRISGLICDGKTGDCLVIGKVDPKRARLTLDDLVVALRARFVHCEYPALSIEFTEDVAHTGNLVVLFNGGIKNTHFGSDMFGADYKLKLLGIGANDFVLNDFEPYWEMILDEIKNRDDLKTEMKTSFWIYPVLSGINAYDEMVVFDNPSLNIQTKVVSYTTDKHGIDNLYNSKNNCETQFADALNRQFHKLTKISPSFLRLQGLIELTALARGVESLDSRPDISFWLTQYKIKKVMSKTEVKLLKREELLNSGAEAKSRESLFRLSGGVRFMVVTSDSNPTAKNLLKDIALKSRPGQDSLSWRFTMDKWMGLPGSNESSGNEVIAQLFAEAAFFEQTRNLGDAIKAYSNIIKLKPDWDWPYNYRASIFRRIRKFNNAVEDCTKALEINPNYAEAFNNRGMANVRRNSFKRATDDFNEALRINPWFASAYNNRGMLYEYSEKHELAIADYTKALEINPLYAQAHFNLGYVYDWNGKHDQAITEYKKTIEIDKRFVEAYFNLAEICAKRGRIKEAIEAYNGFIKYVSPQDIYYKVDAEQKKEKLEKQIKNQS